MNDMTESSSGFLTRPTAYTQPFILQRMLAALAIDLPSLKTQDESDPSIALLDAWAIVLDVLSFYQQQSNQENYLDTATQSSSVRTLLRMVNDELAPGVAASTYLAFQIDPKANNTGVAVIPQGTQAQSLPTNGGQPQIFETSTNFTANATWNQLQPYQPQQIQTDPPTLTGQTTNLRLMGVNNGLSKGDVLLLGGTPSSLTNKTVYYQLTLQSVSIDSPNNSTQVTWQSGWANQDLSGNNITLGATDTLTHPQLWVFRSQVGSFGNNAPLVSSLASNPYYHAGNDWDALGQAGSGKNIIPTIWQNSQAQPNSQTSNLVYLSQLLPNLITDNPSNSTGDNRSWVLLSDNGIQQLCTVSAVNEIARADFGLSGQVSSLTVAPITTPALPTITVIISQNGVQEIYANLQSINSTTFANSNLVTLTSTPSTLPNLTASPIFLQGGTGTDGGSGDKATSPSNAPLNLTAKTAGTSGNQITFSIIGFSFRTTAIYSRSELLTLYTNTTDDATFVLKKANQGITLVSSVQPVLQPGQDLIISNLLETVTESVTWDGNGPTVANLPASTLHSYTFTLTAPLKFSYQPGTTTVTGNSIANPIPVVLDVSNPTAPTFTINATTNPIPTTTTQLTLSGQLVQQSEAFTLASTQEIQGNTVLYPEEDLTYSYHPSTSIIYGNVVAATHGATMTQEVLGSGDATQSNQQFSLQNPPLTYVAADGATEILPGVDSTLTIQANSVTWQEAPSFYGLTPTSKNYVVTQEDGGQVNITFGDGVQGARLPSGQENVVATYRQGIGSTGNVTANSLTLLRSRPQGVTSVTNPSAASGGVDPQSITAAKTNTNSSLLTFNRLVTTADFEAYVSNYPGVSKCKADLLQKNGQPLLYLTIAGINGPLSTDDPSYTKLQQSVTAQSSPGQNIVIGNYIPSQFKLAATLTLKADYTFQDVANNVTTTLSSRYGFSQQNLAQAVIASDVITTIGDVPGVIAVDLTALYLTGGNFALNAVLPANAATVSNNKIQAAQLLTINPQGIAIS